MRMFTLQNILLFVLFQIGAVVAEECQNGGTVIVDITHPACRCLRGYKGYNCSQKVTPCEGKPCRNGAKCKEFKNGTFQCLCTASFTGILCERRVLPCDSGPCKNGGTCTNGDLKCFKCECPLGFKGNDCSETVNPCETKPCKNGGTCTNETSNSFVCSCRRGFGGTFCADELYGSRILIKKDIEQLKGWSGLERSWELCYRATDDGWKAQTFHDRCDGKKPLITIVRVGTYVFGGYSDQGFGGNSGYRASRAAFLFSFVNKDNIQPFKAVVYRNEKNAIYTKPDYGPTFGGGHDFYIKDNARTNAGSYASLGYTYSPPKGYSYGTSETKSLLAGSVNFFPTDVEVYYEI